MKKTILIVEDELPMLKALADKFSLEGFEILEAKDGAEGLEAAISKKPDLIILDIFMPVMDGKAMFEKLRARRLGKNRAGDHSHQSQSGRQNARRADEKRSVLLFHQIEVETGRIGRESEKRIGSVIYYLE